jgi:hypothetical protein
MAFEARKLRVQIPCGPVTLIDCTPGATRYCYWPTQHCPIFTCDWGTHLTCVWDTPWCRYGSPCRGWNSCGFYSPVVDVPIECIAGTSPTYKITELTPNCGTTAVAEGPITVLPEHLGVLKEQLQRQLAEIEEAEKAVAEAEKKAK